MGMYRALESGEGFFKYFLWFVLSAPDDYLFRSANIFFIIIKIYLLLEECPHPTPNILSPAFTNPRTLLYDKS